MKKYSFKIGMQLKGVAQEAIRTKNDLISLLLRAVQYMHFGEPCPEGTEDSFTIEIEKISRISFFLKDKIFSFHFPFTVQDENSDQIIIRCKNRNFNIDSKVLALLLSLCNNNIFDKTFFDMSVLVEDECNSFDEIDNQIEIEYIVRTLLEFEPGYLRYEDDINRANGNIHPRFHIDVFYSDHAKVKLGMYNEITAAWFRDLIDITTNCKFIKS